LKGIESVYWVDQRPPNQADIYVVQISLPDAHSRASLLRRELEEEGWQVQATGHDTKNKKVILVLRRQFNTPQEWESYQEKRMEWTKLLK